MIGLVIVLHSIICILLIIVVLMQSGRGGGLTENFAAAESVFGAKTNAFMVKTTSILGALFFVTCLSLAILSSRKDESLMTKRQAPIRTAPAATPLSAPDIKQPIEEAPATKPAADSASSTDAAPQQPSAPQVPVEGNTPAAGNN